MVPAKKVISLALVLFVLLSFATGCSKSSQDTKGSEAAKSEALSTGDVSNGGEDLPITEITLPIVKEPITLKVFCAIGSQDLQYIKSMNDNLVVKEITKRTGITMDFTHPPVGQGTEQFNIMIASGDLPDVVWGFFDAYKGGVEAAIKEGLIIDVKDLVDKYAPNFKRMILDDKNISKYVYNDDSVLTGFGGTFYGPFESGKPYVGPIIRKDWLDKLGLPMPETIDDWYVVLKAFKDQMNCEVPLAIAHNGREWDPLENSMAFSSAYGVPLRGFFKEDEVVKFVSIEPGYKEFLATFSKWYKEGLISKDFATQEYMQHVQPLVASAKAGAAPMQIYWFGQIYNDIKKADPNAVYVPAPLPTLQKGEKLTLRNVWAGFSGGRYITKNCEHPVEAVKFIDWFYTDEAKRLTNWGIEGESYQMVDGVEQFTEATLKDQGRAATIYYNNVLKEAMDMRQAEGQYTLKEQHDAWDLWMNGASVEGLMPSGITLTEAESTSYTTLITDIQSYTDEMLVKFIMGVEPIDKFDAYVEKVKSMKVDEAIKIQQAALDRFNKR